MKNLLEKYNIGNIYPEEYCNTDFTYLNQTCYCFTKNISNKWLPNGQLNCFFFKSCLNAANNQECINHECNNNFTNKPNNPDCLYLVKSDLKGWCTHTNKLIYAGEFLM